MPSFQVKTTVPFHEFAAGAWLKFVESLPMAVVIVDSGAAILYLNAAAWKLFPDGLEKLRVGSEPRNLAGIFNAMEGMHGLQVLEEILELDSDAKVLIASADIQSSTKEMVRQKGGIGFVNKPFTEEHILPAVNQAIEGDKS